MITARGEKIEDGAEGTVATDFITLSQLSNVYSSGVFNTRNIIAGSGIAGGGTLSQDRTFNIGAADTTITVNADTIQVGVITTANITNNAVDNTKLRDSVGTSVIGRSANSTGDPADIVASASGQFLRRDGSNVLGFGSIVLSDLPSGLSTTTGILTTINTSTLNTLNISGYPSLTTLCFMQSRRCWLQLDKSSTLTPDNSTIFAATTGNWLRLFTSDQFWLSQIYWAIDPVNGSDDNIGCGVNQAAADAAPLKTIREANIRQFGSAISQQVFWHILNDVPITDNSVMNFVQCANGAGYPTMYGEKRVLGTYHITAYATAVPTSNTGYILTATPTGGTTTLISDTSMLKGYVLANGTFISGFIQSSPGTNQVRIGVPDKIQPLDYNNTDLGVRADFIVGQNITVYDFPQIPTHPFTGGACLNAYSAIAWLKYNYGYRINFTYSNFCGSNTIISHCINEGGINVCPGFGSLNGVLFTQDATAGFESVLSGGQWFFSHCSIRGPSVSNGNGTLSIQGNAFATFNVINGDVPSIDIEHGTLLLEHGALANGVGAMSVFNCTNSGAAVSCFLDSFYGQQVGNTFGSGNTVPYIKVEPGSKAKIPVSSGQATYVTSSSQMIIAGANRNFSDIPVGGAYVDGSTLTVVNDGGVN